MLVTPEVPTKILANSRHTEEAEVMAQPNHVFFIEREEYPEGGGVLVYKYGGRVEPMEFDFAPYVEKGNQLQKELEQLLAKYDFSLIGQDRQPTMLIPSDFIRLEQKQKIIERVDLLYPEKGFPDPLAVALNNQVKKVLKNEIHFFGYKWTALAFFPFLFLPYKIKIKIFERWLDGWTYWSKQTLRPRLMESRYYTACARQIEETLSFFLRELQINPNYADRAGKVFAEIIERDSAYRFRLEDILSETTKEQLIRDPRGELMRLFDIFCQREHVSGKLRDTVKSFVRVISLLTYLPRFRKALAKALGASKFENFQFDDIDRYAVVRLDGYEFFGIPYHTRFLAYLIQHKFNPPQYGWVQSKGGAT